MQPDRAYSFTTTSPVKLWELTNECGVSRGWNPESDGPRPAIGRFMALWDTGATESVISQAVVDTCGLTPIGMVQVSHVAGVSSLEVYVVNIILPNDVEFPLLSVTKGSFVDVDVLVGMDIIGEGDFAVTNQNGRTKFTYRWPSVEDIDFVAG